jgi:uncharacterized protein (DUF433 family)
VRRRASSKRRQSWNYFEKGQTIVFVPINNPTNVSVEHAFRTLADELCDEHPSISTEKGIFGGMPHIKNVRLSVGDILAKLYVYGSVQAILDIYSPDVNEEQIKEAIAYAQDFLETACDPRQSPQVNG